MKKSLFIFIILVNYVFSQTNDPNLWQDFLPYNQVKQVVKNGEMVFASTENSLFSYNISDESIERFSKVNRLNDIGVAAINFNDASNSLVVGYKNGNIDIISGNETIGQASIKYSSIVGDKTIHHLYSENEKTYISTGFGIVVINVSTNEVLETYIIGDNGNQLSVNAITIDGNVIYAATDKGIKKADKTSAFLSNSSLWTTDLTIPNFSKPQANIIKYNDSIFVTYEPQNSDPDTIYFYDGITWNVFTPLLGYDIKSTTIGNGKLVVTTQDDVWVYDKDFMLVNHFQDSKLNYAVYDENNIFWVGDAVEEGLIKAESTSINQNIIPQGPYRKNVFSFSRIIDGKFWIAAGGVRGTLATPTYNIEGVSFYDGTYWKPYNKNKTSELEDPTWWDYLYIDADPKDVYHVVFTNYTNGGMFEFKNGAFTRYTDANSTLQKSASTPNQYHLGGVLFDDDENVWVLNSFLSNFLSVKTPDNKWVSYNFGSAFIDHWFQEIFIDSRNYIWMVSPSGGGVVVLNPNGTPEDLTDDQIRILDTSPGNGNLPSSQVWTVSEDLDGLIWIGTTVGPAVFFNPENIFSTSDEIDAKQIFIEQDGNTEILLATDRVTAIEVDGANRKWMATTNSGLYVFEEDSYKEVYHFTRENSPLFSNNIFDLKMDKDNGVIYITTDEGMLSFKNDATDPTLDFSETYAYPNPVQPGYRGNIFINGLMRNTNLKITDTEGNLVKELQSLGGQATWDGTDLFGNSVKSGVYLVFLTSADGSKTEVTKIMVIR